MSVFSIMSKRNANLIGIMILSINSHLLAQHRPFLTSQILIKLRPTPNLAFTVQIGLLETGPSSISSLTFWKKVFMFFMFFYALLFKKRDLLLLPDWPLMLKSWWLIIPLHYTNKGFYGHQIDFLITKIIIFNWFWSTVLPESSFLDVSVHHFQCTVFFMLLVKHQPNANCNNFSFSANQDDLEVS